jgi:acyl transferase domain-containing protein
MDGIAIIGMSGRFPGATNTQGLWQNVRNGIESISFFTGEELAQAGIPASALDQSSFVNAGGVLDDVDRFDAPFFGFNARDAEIMDPQQRLFLECAWESLEDAGYDADTYEGAVGVYAGQSLSTYVFNIYNSPERVGHIDHMQLLLLNDKDHLTTHVSYKLNLTGPSMAIQSACSTSLVAVCVACDALWNRRCDMALAGGVGISIPQRSGYTYLPGGIMSPDGHCRSFDAAARGTVSGNGVGIVVLKRLADALADRDHIYAVIRGAALNNDGSFKVGYTAPSVAGQAAVIAAAQAMADVHPDTISYIEAHGTATQLGDPIEVAALTEAFRIKTDRKGFCAIGSIKTNVGHLDPAAGVAGLIKTALALYHRELPPSLHFKEPNPQIDFASSPFFVNTALTEWQADGTPRRAGVSSFGIGGTNAHCVLEERPTVEASGPSRSQIVVPLSAKTKSALDAQTDRLAAYLRTHPDVNIADVAYVHQVGRKKFAHRRVLVADAGNAGRAASLLEGRDPERLLSNAGDARERLVAFLFPGQGSQYIDMGRQLYATEDVFRDALDRCCELLRPHLGTSLIDLLHPGPAANVEAIERLAHTASTQPALFAIEYALSQLWMAWGVTPQAMIGHSIGEYVAACLAGVMSLEDALHLVALRGRLMDSMPRGAMLAIPLSELECSIALGGTLSLAAINGPASSVVSGPLEEIMELERRLAARGLPSKLLATSHAFHSPMMERAVAPFVEVVRGVALAAPQIPYLSNVTGTWMTPADAVDPEYYGRQLRQPVRFADGLAALLGDPDWVFLEVGPGRTLSGLTRQQATGVKPVIVATLGTGREPRSDSAFVLEALGRLWLNGVSIAWASFKAGERRNRLPLPAYPFERQRYWVGPADKPVAPGTAASTGARRPLGDWFYVPSWMQIEPVTSGWTTRSFGERWLIFADSLGVADELERHLRSQEQHVTIVNEGGAFRREREHVYSVRANVETDYDELLGALERSGTLPHHIVHLWLLTEGEDHIADAATRYEQLGFSSLMCLAQALGRHSSPHALELDVVSNRLQAVVNGDHVSPAKALVLGPCRVIPEEYPSLTCRNIDLAADEPAVTAVNQILREITEEAVSPVVAYRDGARWLQTYEPVRLEPAAHAPQLKDGGVYLLTGGLGGIALSLAHSLAQAVEAPRLVLVSRSTLPERESWDEWVAAHGDADATSATLRRLREIEAAGAEVMLASADVADRAAMAPIVDEVVRRFGALHGVVHAAGIAGGGMIQLKAPHVAAAVLAPKVQGTLVLDALLKERPLDFFAICSSLASVYGGFGQVDYCAANNFLDAYAQARAADGMPVVSINWDTWCEVGMAVKTVVPPELQETRLRSLELGITPHEGADAFLTILASGLPQVAVSTTDLQVTLEGGSKLTAETIALPADPLAAPVRKVHPRPSFGTAYVEPSTDTEQTLADLWQDLLGVAPVGLHDNFFEFGGHSLLAIQLISQVRMLLECELSVQNLFDKPTVANLAAQIDALRLELADADTMVRLLNQVEQMSDGEVEALLGSGATPALLTDRVRSHSG